MHYSTAMLSCVDDASANKGPAWPQLYSVTYYLSTANFIGNPDEASMTYTAESSMHLDILQTTSLVTFHSQDLQYTSVSYTVGDQGGEICVCGQEEQCPTTSCSSVLQPPG